MKQQATWIQIETPPTKTLHENLLKIGRFRSIVFSLIQLNIYNLEIYNLQI